MCNKVYNSNNNLIHEYNTFYNHPFFCTPVTHSNGRQYLVLKEDLYGYSVLDIESKQTFKYIAAYLTSEETFIAVDISYNSANDIVAATGCFWGEQHTTFLFEVKDPMKQFNRYLDIGSIVPNRRKYNEVDFHDWEGTDILLKCSLVDESGYEIIKIPKARYMRFLSVYLI